MKVSIIEFPESCGVEETRYAFEEILNCSTQIVWHKSETIGKPDLIVLPGGSSFSDFLRPGALAKVSRVVAPIRKYAKSGGPILGLGNGFQVLCEMNLLPGVLLPNFNNRFLATTCHLRLESNSSVFLSDLAVDTVFTLPIACFYGRYFINSRDLIELEDSDQIAFRYCDRHGEVDEANPFNGCVGSIAAVTNLEKNILGMMAHPERALDPSMAAPTGRELLLPMLEKFFAAA